MATKEKIAIERPAAAATAAEDPMATRTNRPAGSGLGALPSNVVPRTGRTFVPCHPLSLAFAVVAGLIAVAVMTMVDSPAPVKPRVWTSEELARHNGTHRRLPLLLSILGSVFDVTRGRSHYAPGGGYHHFTGRDASRAFVSGNFTGDGLTDDLQGLSALQIKRIADWKIRLQKKYIYRGTLVGTFYDELGEPTEEMMRVTKEVAIGEGVVQQQKEDKIRFPNCNSRWNAEEGGEVWCNTGYPRIVDRVSEGVYKGTTGTRCACFEEKFLAKEGLQVYEGCSPSAKRCQSAPPQM